MKCPDRVLVDLGRLPATPLENVSGSIEERLLPLVDHRWMHAVRGGQFRNGAFALYSFERHARLEARVMIPAFAHVLISSSLEISRRHIVASVTVRISGSTSAGVSPGFFDFDERLAALSA